MLKNKTGNISHVKCSVCKQEKQVNPTVRAKRLEKYGTVEGIEASWICKACTDKAMVSLKGNGIKVKVKAEKGTPIGDLDIQPIPKGPVRDKNGRFLKTPKNV